MGLFVECFKTIPIQIPIYLRDVCVLKLRSIFIIPGTYEIEEISWGCLLYRL